MNITLLSSMKNFGEVKFPSVKETPSLHEKILCVKKVFEVFHNLLCAFSLATGSRGSEIFWQ